MNKLDQKLIEFFASHPEATVVFAALGILFTDYNKATAYCGGTAGKPITYTREQVEALDDEATDQMHETLMNLQAPVEEVETPAAGEEDEALAAGEEVETPAAGEEDEATGKIEKQAAPSKKKKK